MAERVQLRPEQEAIVSGYAGGKVGVAAVPGSGKTFTLSHLAARLVATLAREGAFGLDGEREVLVVTFTNSGVNSFRARIDRVLREQYGLLSYIGYRVRTLHGLAHDIVRERPALVGLADDFTILDEKSALDIQRDIVLQRLSDWWPLFESYSKQSDDITPKSLRYRLEQDLPGLILSFIKRAKDLRVTPEMLAVPLRRGGSEVDLARFATEVYADYQRSLAYRGAVDFDDLVRLALEALQRDSQYLRRLRARWPYILEDEAQDSSRLQQEMLELLSEGRNWVRVGDPNQAINTTFTTADPQFLLDFLDVSLTPDVAERPLSVSGRSAPAIIDLANELVRWTAEEHPVPVLRDAFNYTHDTVRHVRRGVILPTEGDDPQQNPPDEQALIHIAYTPGQKITPEREREMVAAGEWFSLSELFRELEGVPQAERPTVAVLVPENSHGFKLTDLLRKHDIPYEELLRSTTETREAVAQLRTVLEYLVEPTDLRKLKQVYWSVMPPDQRAQVFEDLDLRQTLTRAFQHLRNVEDFLWPSDPEAVLRGLPVGEQHAWLLDAFAEFRRRVQRWLEATVLPVDQLVLTIGGDLFSEPVDVALGYKVAVLLRGLAQSHPDWRLPEFAAELGVISGNERKFIGFDDAEVGYEPKPGIVTVATMHAAKGLEWDRVYLMAASNYAFPSGQPYDTYIGERWYVRDSLNLEAELLAQLDRLAGIERDAYREGEATLRARLDYARERLRLLYVGITRARKELIVTWNIGRFWQNGIENQPAVPVLALYGYLQRERDEV
ncbi:MAG TPA: ATP-dependent helicase [Aggregatilineaceae bacterium]|nr:ATP-dependent helicase [Aggregatilineaceae bacterium]